MKPGIGIRFQLTAGIVLTTLAGIGLIGLLSISIVERSAVNWKVSESVSIARIIRAAAGMPGASADPLALVKYASAALKESGISDYTVTDPAGEALVSGGRLVDEGSDVIYFEGDIKVTRIGGGWLLDPGKALYISAPLGAPGRGGAGAIRFTVSLAGINQDIAGIRKFLLLYALLDSLVIIGFGIYFLSKSIVNPIRKLEQTATRIASGGLSERAVIQADNEVGSLASSFNTMAERLESEIMSLERVNKELTTAQEQVLRSSTLAVVGRLAAGIAHEVGNPLGAVHGYLDILFRGGSDKDEEKEILERTVKEVERIDFIIREFLEISRPPKASAEPVDINVIIEETLSTLGAHKDFNGIEKRFMLKEELPKVLIDGRKLRQVLMNILLNAAHALSAQDGDKTITIESGFEVKAPARRRRRDDPQLSPPPDRTYVFIRISDTGSGISEDDAKKIFEPFFTTKDVGKGTGLGLFVSQSIIKTYGGEITLDPRPGAGACFTVSLPAGETE
ncbi:MAG: HAMP domain-containing protein [Deltaproteobacteria bacterium]|nr:HAMP domain-containing protein [Deltaproteobacteria bacterium]